MESLQRKLGRGHPGRGPLAPPAAPHQGTAGTPPAPRGGHESAGRAAGIRCFHPMGAGCEGGGGRGIQVAARLLSFPGVSAPPYDSDEK